MRYINWKQISDFPMYRISDTGLVQNISTGKLLKHKLNDRYPKVALYNNGKATYHYVHRLVAKYFIPNPTCLPTVLHKDNNKVNPDASNLYWGTYSNNSQQALTDGICYKNKRGIEQYKDDILVNVYPSLSEAARILGCSISSIHGALRKKQKAMGFTFKYAEEVVSNALE